MKIINRIAIEAPPATVFRWLDDPDRARQWMTSVADSEFIEETPGKVGTTFRERVEEDHQGVDMLGEVTEFIPNERFAVHLESDRHTADVRFVLEEHTDGTRLTQHIDLRLKGLSRVLTPFLRPALTKKVRAQASSEFATLKRLCEQDEA